MSINHSYCTRSNPHRLAENAEEIEKAIAGGNTQTDFLKKELKHDGSWKAAAWNIAKIATLGFIAACMIYECYDLQKSTQNLYAQNLEYGKQKFNVHASNIMQQIATANPSLQCSINAEVVDLLSCYAQGLTQYFTKR